ncbi:hypothetical protein LIN78_15050 [Leeia sp. TBRC 13508]|uniref:histidine kinase n=1 Tax=Leeia speluncae TaxID=2884804 RepID=A0ABS8D9L1_9NEIS|nr:ATP-binding protein [Leeia speluncae]MCB6184864.1 hypothetical protein [Leeia speluncae]
MKRKSLFRQLILSHLLLSVLISVIVWFTFVLERNRTVSELLSNRWATSLLTVQTNPKNIPNDGLRAVPAPARRQPLIQFAPRNWILKNTLKERGLHIGNIQINPDNFDELWIELNTEKDGIKWFAIHSPLLENAVRGRVILAVLLSLLAIAGISWWKVKRIIQPLRQIETAIKGQQTVGSLPKYTAQEISLIAETYNQLKAAQEKQSAERSLLLAGVSHDLRSPLARIKTAASLLPDDPAISTKAAMISRNVDVADQLIGSFLEYVRAGAAPVDHTVCFADAFSTLREIYKDVPEVGFQVSDASALDRPLKAANVTLLVRAIQNLIDNALHHGKPPVSLILSQNSEALVVEVIDTGKGISEEESATLWQAFARGDSSRGRPGTGLGLAIVKQIADRFEARIETERQAAGWCCRLIIPFKQSI